MKHITSRGIISSPKENRTSLFQRFQVIKTKKSERVCIASYALKHQHLHHEDGKAKHQRSQESLSRHKLHAPH
jgi:hypothetical protein